MSSNEWYLKEAKKRAKQNGYNAKDLYLADDKKHKLMIKDTNNKFHYFGRIGYGDFLLYRKLEKEGKVPIGTAEIMRNRYHKSHSKIKGDWIKNKFSPNMLSLMINW